MTRMQYSSRNVSNVGFKGRVRQVVLLVLAIVLGVIISTAVGAQDFHKAKNRHFKSKYRTQIRMADRLCDLLEKKRNAKRKSPSFAWHRKPKAKTPAPQAEVDLPGPPSHGGLVASFK